jgi:SAM-dependent methyltransferase
MRHTEVRYFSDPAPHRDKERLYTEVRRREGRLQPDEAVRRLPYATGPLAGEWRRRRRSFERFLVYCRKKKSLNNDAPLRILDLGCGNGWMANRLAEDPGREVWAVDVNEEELAQGARLFGRDNLHFGYADLVPRNAVPESMPGTAFRDTGSFDLIVLAAAVQYFPDLTDAINTLKTCLNPGGEIHILDSPFYPDEAAREAARQRTLEYYTAAGVPGMAAFYHHHLWADAEQAGGEDLNKRLFIKILQKTGWIAPFPWVRFRRD